MKLTYTILLCCLSILANGQSSELILMGGTSHFLGDLGGKNGLGTNEISDLDFNTTRYSLGIGIRFRFNESFALRMNAFYARVAGDDANTDNPERLGRNLNFFSPILEGNLMGEFYLGSTKRLYIFGGIGTFYFNPKTKYQGKKYELQPLGTEGQNYLPNQQPYDRTAISYPFGIGYKIPLNNGSVLGLEVMMRKSSTDYIDDVSGNYANATQIANAGGAIAGILSDRSTSSIPGFSDEGAIRGDPNDLDNFTFLLVTYSVPLQGPSGSSFGGSRKRSRGGRKRDRCFEF